MNQPLPDVPDYGYLFLQQFDSYPTRKQYRHFLMFTIQMLEARGRDILTATADDFVQMGEDVRRVKADWSNSTWNVWVACLNSLYEFLIETGRCTLNPARMLRKRRPDQKIMPAPDANEVKRMWELLLSPVLWEKATEYQRKQLVRDRAIFALLVGCGLRVSTLSALNIENMVLESRQIQVKVKGGSIKTFIWPEGATPYLKPMLEGREPHEPLFCNTHGTRIAEGTVRAMLQKLCTACKLPYYAPHAFRRYGATTMFQQGVNPELIRRWGGWSKLDTALRYNVDKNKPVDIGQMPM